MPVRINEERQGLPELILEHQNSRARLSLQGAHITEYVAHGENLLWLSRSARFSAGAAIRGGIPVCWPWFGASPDNAAWPQHGFARTSRFRLVSQRSDARQVAVTLALDEAPPVDEWRGAASLEVEIRLSDKLWMEVRTENLTDRDLLVGVGLHGYFRVSNASAVSLPALTGLDYLDKPSGYARRSQASPLQIRGEIDRVYQQPPASAALVDPARPGKLLVDAWGHTDLVVWNPGPAVAQSLGDFDDDGYQSMVCVEPALALANRRRLSPGASFSVGQSIEWVRDDASPQA